MKNIIVKINDAVQTVQEVAVVTNDGQPTVIKGVKNVNYQLIDQATGRGPDHIVTLLVPSPKLTSPSILPPKVTVSSPLPPVTLPAEPT